MHPSGKALTLSDGEGKSASVELSEPVSDQISILQLSLCVCVIVSYEGGALSSVPFSWTRS